LAHSDVPKADKRISGPWQVPEEGQRCKNRARRSLRVSQLTSADTSGAGGRLVQGRGRGTVRRRGPSDRGQGRRDARRQQSGAALPGTRGREGARPFPVSQRCSGCVAGDRRPGKRGEGDDAADTLRRDVPRGTYSRADNDSRSAANKVRQCYTRSSRHSARDTPQGASACRSGARWRTRLRSVGRGDRCTLLQQGEGRFISNNSPSGSFSVMSGERSRIELPH
jgi:hypothetical protein